MQALALIALWTVGAGLAVPPSGADGRGAASYHHRSGGPPQRADKLARELAPRVRKLQQRFEEGRRRLETVESAGGPILDPGPLLALLATTEEELLAALRARELAPLRAWIEDFFRQLRAELPEGASARSGRSARARPGAVFAALGPSPQQPGAAGTARGRQATVLDRISDFLAQLLSRAEAGELATDVCLRSLPEPGVEVQLFPHGYRRRVVADVTERAVRVVYRGLYGYVVAARTDDAFACRDRSCPLLDLWVDEGPFIACEFSTATCYLRPGDLEDCGR